MNRPAPRKSSLAGSSPVAPPVSSPAPEQPAAEILESHVIERSPAADAAADEVVRDLKRERSSKKQGSGPKYPPKVSFYQDPADTDRMRAAIMHTMAYEGFRGLSQFMQEAAMEKVERLEQKYNDGKPFGSAGARELPQGRPMGE